MVPTIAFSGLESSVWALAGAVAIAASSHWTDAWLASIAMRSNLTRPDLERLARMPVAHGLLGILGHQPLELALGAFGVGMGLSGLKKQARKFGPGVGGIHVDYADCFDPWFRARNRKVRRLRLS
jgi:hypothetical protein